MILFLNFYFLVSCFDCCTRFSIGYSAKWSSCTVWTIQPHQGECREMCSETDWCRLSIFFKLSIKSSKLYVKWNIKSNFPSQDCQNAIREMNDTRTPGGARIQVFQPTDSTNSRNWKKQKLWKMIFYKISAIINFPNSFDHFSIFSCINLWWCFLKKCIMYYHNFLSRSPSNQLRNISPPPSQKF